MSRIEIDNIRRNALRLLPPDLLRLTVLRQTTIGSTATSLKQPNLNQTASTIPGAVQGFMRMSFDYERFNGFARKKLDDLLFGDLWSFYIFNESDMHSAAYYYIRDYFRKKDRDGCFVRCEPMLAGMKPDIVIYTKGKPTYVLEFKMFSKPDAVNDDAVVNDLEKLAAVIETFPTVKWGFFHMIYDADDMYTITDGRLRRAGLKKMSVTTINARRKENSGRRRVGYDEWRATFDALCTAHKEHA